MTTPLPPLPEGEAVSLTTLAHDARSRRRSSSSSSGSIVSALTKGRRMSTAQTFTTRVYKNIDLNDEHMIMEHTSKTDSEGEYMVAEDVTGEIKAIEAMKDEDNEDNEVYSNPHSVYFRPIRKNVSKDFKHRMRNVQVNWNRLKHVYKLFKNKRPEQYYLSHHIKIMEGHFGSGIGTMFVFIRWVICLNIGLSLLWSIFIVIPMAFSYNYGSSNQKFAFKDLLDGQGAVGQSWFFFGAYAVELGSYHMGLAYLIMILVTYFGSLVIILITIAAAEDPISGSKQFNSRFAYSLIMWTSWDHSVTTHEATNNLSKGIASAFKDHMYEEKEKHQKRLRNLEDPRGTFLRRVLAWFITLLLVGSGCTGITYMVITVSVTRTNESLSFMKIYVTPIFISLVNVIVPFCIRMLAKIERYSSGQKELNVTLARIFVLRMVYLITLITSVIYKSNQRVSGTIADVIVYFGRYLWTYEKQEYTISTSVLVLIYRQSLILAGTMTCPMLPIIGLASSVQFFFIVYYVMLYTCKPPLKRWKQSRKTQFIMTFLLISLLCIIFAVSFIIGSDYVDLGKTLSPDIRKGPFRSGKVPTDMFALFIESLNETQVSLFFHWIVSQTVVFPLFLILLCCLTYQYKLITTENKHTLILQVELQQERADNKILAKKLRDHIDNAFGKNNQFYDDEFEDEMLEENRYDNEYFDTLQELPNENKFKNRTFDNRHDNEKQTLIKVETHI